MVHLGGEELISFYKIVYNNVITGFGTNGADVMEITETEYSELVSMFRNRPTAPEGYGYVLQNEPREWVLVELPPAPEDEDISPEEAIDILLGGDGE